MTEEDDFLRAVADPADVATRLVFTDWLLERGDERAEFVRLDSELRGMTGDEPAFAAMQQRWRDWRARLPRLWLGAFGHLFTAEELRRAGVRAETHGVVALGLRTVAVLAEAFFSEADFLQPQPLERMWIIRGRRDVMSGLRFWLETSHGYPWPPFPEGTPACTPLTEVSWKKGVVGALQRLNRPVPSPWDGKGAFHAAVHLVGNQGSQGWLAAHAREYIAVAWHTTG